METNLPEKQNIKSESPSSLMVGINNFFKAKLATQVTTLEDMVDAHMIEQISSSGNNEDIKHINFHIELVNNEFIIKPHNFFTYLLSEGIYVPNNELGDSFIYKTGDGIYKMEIIENEQKFTFIPKKYLS